MIWFALIIKSFKMVLSLIKADLVNGLKIKYCKFLIKRRINLILILRTNEIIVLFNLVLLIVCEINKSKFVTTQNVFKELKSGCVFVRDFLIL